MSVSPRTRQQSTPPEHMPLPGLSFKAQGSASVLLENQPHAVLRFESVSGDTLRSSSPNNRPLVKTVTSHDSSPGKTGRAVMIEFHPEGRASQHPLTSIEFLENYLDERCDSVTPRRRLYLLEGTLAEHTNTLESHFRIEKTFFRKHRRSSRGDLDHVAKSAPLLPSLVNPQKTWCLNYHVLESFEEKWASNWVRCVKNGRRIELSRINGTLDEAGIVERKASYWSHTNDNGGWDGE